MHPVPDPPVAVHTYVAPDLTGTGMSYREQPVTYHGEGEEFPFVYSGRRVVEIPGRTWPAARPEECTFTTCLGDWITPQLLVCSGCGLDCT